jgi:hypothetical protein
MLGITTPPRCCLHPWRHYHIPYTPAPYCPIHVDRVMAVLKFCFPLGGVALESGGPVVAFGSSLLTAGSCRVAMWSCCIGQLKIIVQFDWLRVLVIIFFCCLVFFCVFSSTFTARWMVALMIANSAYTNLKPDESFPSRNKKRSSWFTMSK